MYCYIQQRASSLQFALSQLNSPTARYSPTSFDVRVTQLTCNFSALHHSLIRVASNTARNHVTKVSDFHFHMTFSSSLCENKNRSRLTIFFFFPPLPPPLAIRRVFVPWPTRSPSSKHVSPFLSPSSSVCEANLWHPS